MKRMLLASLLLLLSGCGGLPQPREMGDMALLRTVGVDARGDAWMVSASTGARASGLQGEGQPALRLSAPGESLSGACLALQKGSDSYVFFGYADQLLVGEGAARRDIRPVLDYFARDRELGLGAQIWLVRGSTAQQALATGGDTGVEGRLSTLRIDSELGVAAGVRTVGEVYADLLEQGSVWIPALSVEGGERLMEGGYAVLRGGALLGWLDGEAARGLELLTGQSRQDILELETDGGPIALWIREVRTDCRLAEGGTQLEISCWIDARAVEYDTPPTRKERENLREQVGRRERERLEDALEQLRGWGADCVGLGQRAGIWAPAEWERLRSDWEMQFGEIPLRLEVEVTLPAPAGE